MGIDCPTPRFAKLVPRAFSAREADHGECGQQKCTSNRGVVMESVVVFLLACFVYWFALL
ncbi:hypothetical protein BH686_14515 [Rhodococcus erythropolis]|nr:hypothetical protein XU06_02340 [Rhodococcus erythropolis]ORI23325.1 hypothetical protein BH686_14515 [Rhodococcus erythropolis]